MDKIFSTKISAHQGHLFEVGLFACYDGIKQWWRVEVRLLDSNGHPTANAAIVLDEQFAKVAIADESWRQSSTQTRSRALMHTG